MSQCKKEIRSPLTSKLSKQYLELVCSLGDASYKKIQNFAGVGMSDEVRPFVEEYAEHYNVSNIPLVVAQPLVDEFEHFTANISRILYQVFKRYVDVEGDALSQMLGSAVMSVSLAKHHNIDVRDFLMRHDMVVSNGQLKLLEVNAGSKVGGWQLDFFAPLMEQIISNSEPMTGWNVKYVPVLESMFTAVANSIRRLKPTAQGNVVLMMDRDTENTCLAPLFSQLFQTVTHAMLPNAKLSVIYDIALFDFVGDKVFYQHQEVDAVMLSTIEQLPDSIASRFTKACIEGHCFMPDSPNYAWVNDKNLLALAHEAVERGWLEEKDSQFVQAFIPWSKILGRAVSSGEDVQVLKNKLISEQNQLVLKKARSLQGQDVFIGRFTPSEQWQALIEKHVNDSEWLIQSYCEPDLVPCFSEKFGNAEISQVLGIFDFGNRYKGGFIRGAWKGTCEDGVVNSAKGASEFMLYQDNKKKNRLVI